MKRVKQRRRVKPRNPLAANPLLRKGSAHARRDKLASRARRKARLRREATEES